MPCWLERLREDESACGHAEAYGEHLRHEFAAMGDATIFRQMQPIVQRALFEFFDEVVEYSDRCRVRIKVVDELWRLVAVLRPGGRIKARETLSNFAIALLLGEEIAGSAVRVTSFGRNAQGELLIDPSRDVLSYAVRSSTVFLPDDLEAATSKVDRLASRRSDDQALANQDLPAEFPVNIIETIIACRQAETGNVPLAVLRGRLTAAERDLLLGLAERSARLAELALGVDDRVGGNHRTRTLVDYINRPPLANFGLKLLEAGFTRDADRRLLVTSDGEVDWSRFGRLVDLLVHGFNVANDIRREHPELLGLDLLIGYQPGKEASGYDELRDGEQSFERALRRENRPAYVAKRLFMALVRKYESFFVLRLVNRFLDYYDLRLQEIDREPIRGTYDLFFSGILYELRKWEREIENQLKDGILRPYQLFPRASGQAVETPVVPDEMLSVPLPLAYHAGSGIFARPERTFVGSLIDVRFQENRAKSDACLDAWRQLADFFPPAALQVRPVQFFQGQPVGHR